MTSEPSVLRALRERVSCDHFDPGKTLTEAQLRELVDDATRAPSSFNLQHWRFVAIVKPGDKERLRAAAFGQQKIADAPAVFLVLGDLRAHELLTEALSPEVKSGVMPKKVADAWVAQAAKAYGSNLTRAREEAVRSCSLAAMALMLAAEARGYASAPMIGFDPDAVCREFAVPERYVPAMLVAVGYRGVKPQKQRARFPVERVLAFDKCKEVF
jgi:nitroreductase